MSAAQRTNLEEHLFACNRCARRAEVLASAEAALRRQRSPSVGFADRVMRRVAQDLPVEAPRRFPRLFFAYALPTAAALLIALGVLSNGRRPVPGPATSPSARIVELELADVRARSVAVAGDFNGWDAAQMKLGADGVWRVRLALPPGRYQYSFVIDGEKWMPDPHATTVVDSGFSGTNSVLDVTL